MARLSLYAHPHLRNSGSYFGYAYTFNEIQKYMQTVQTTEGALNVNLNSPKCKTQLYYGSPPGTFYPHQFKIHMVQWESTRIPDSWVNYFAEYDEIWTANQFGADAFSNSGIDRSKIYVFEHGVDASVWTPHERGKRNKVRFLHVDSGSPRKRADIALAAFKRAFRDHRDYELTLKYSYTPDTERNWLDQSVLENAGDWDGNVRRIHENIPLDGLVALFHYHDVLIYPSEGEGFGLIPLQALATGMPIISTSRWCSYEHLFSNTVIDSQLGTSHIIETYERPGDVVLPNIDSAVAVMLDVAGRMNKYSRQFFENVNNVVSEYSWQNFCQRAIDDFIARNGISMLGHDLGYMR